MLSINIDVGSVRLTLAPTDHGTMELKLEDGGGTVSIDMDYPTVQAFRQVMNTLSDPMERNHYSNQCSPTPLYLDKSIELLEQIHAAVTIPTE